MSLTNVKPETPHYFIRVNGDTLHNNPKKPACFVPREPPNWPIVYFSYIDYCLNNEIIRIGWPAVGDLRKQKDVPKVTPCYGLIESHIRDYLAEFRDIAQGSVILMPDKNRPGIIYIGTTIGTYLYHFDVPNDPFECAHRISVKWDRNGRYFVEYDANALGITIRGGFWMRAFHRMDRSQVPAVIQRIRIARESAGRVS